MSGINKLDKSNVQLDQTKVQTGTVENKQGLDIKKPEQEKQKSWLFSKLTSVFTGATGIFKGLGSHIVSNKSWLFSKLTGAAGIFKDLSGYKVSKNVDINTLSDDIAKLKDEITAKLDEIEKSTGKKIENPLNAPQSCPALRLNKLVNDLAGSTSKYGFGSASRMLTSVKEEMEQIKKNNNPETVKNANQMFKKCIDDLQEIKNEHEIYLKEIPLKLENVKKLALVLKRFLQACHGRVFLRQYRGGVFLTHGWFG